MKLIESQHWQMSLHLLENMRCHVVNADSSSYTANLNSFDTKTCYANRNLNIFFVLSCGTFDFLSSTELHCLLLPHWSISGQKTLANPSAALHKAEFEGEGFGRQKCDHQCLWKSRSLDKK